MPVAAPIKGIDPDQTYYLQNQHKGPAAFNFGDAMRGQQFKWAGKGDPSGDDILGLPGFVVRDPQFQNALRKGLFAFVEEGSLPVSDSDVAFGDTAFATEAMAQMERPKENELVELHCICPLKGGKQCGETLFKRRSQISEDPPLCAQHEKFAPRFAWNGTEWERADTP
jgi:hypothetical protein